MLFAFLVSCPTLLKEQTMNINVGTADRAVRIIVGVLLVALTLSGQIGAWGWIGVLPILTGFFRICPAYSLLGMNTCGLKK